jgi:drug/metabolite transporter (DMT)-like permease
MTAVISGAAVFINGYGVRAWAGTASPTSYTTLKNGVAAFVLLGAGLVLTRRRSREGLTRPSSRKQWVGLALVATLGGALAFALFFEGLARASSSQAAFIHKTLIIWVGILAVGLLHEKVRPMHVAAIGLLVAGQFVLVGGISGVTIGVGELMIFGATLLWSVEIILSKRLLADLSSLTVGLARMAGGAALLIMFGIFNGSLAAVGAVSLAQISWVLVTGVVLSGYVASWYAALARAPALDVTAILVAGAVITVLLRSVVDGAALPPPLGLGLVLGGTAVAIAAALRAVRDGPAVELNS